MPIQFVPKWSNLPDRTLFYIATHDTVLIQDRAVQSFDLKDSKGRDVGMSVTFTHHTVKLAETEAEKASGHGMLHVDGDQLIYFQGKAISTRNGATFGSATITVKASTLEGCKREMHARIVRAEKAAAKKFAAAVAA